MLMLILVLLKIFLKFLIGGISESDKIVTLEFITLFYRVRIMLVERRSQHPLRILQAFLPFKGACAIDLSVLKCDV